MNQAVFRADLHPAAIAGIAVDVFVHHAMHRGPTADIAPAEVGFDGEDSALGAGFFQNCKVDGDARHLADIRGAMVRRSVGAGISEWFARGGFVDAAERRADLRLIAINRSNNNEAFQTKMPLFHSEPWRISFFAVASLGFSVNLLTWNAPPASPPVGRLFMM